ncbi:MAG: response regulator [Thermoplasmatota archaeon]
MIGLILVVDDAPAVLEALTTVLNRLGTYGKTVTASDPRTALEIFHAKQPRVVLIDVDLAGESGDQAAIQILHDSPSTKVIVMTGLDPGDARVRAVVSAGAYALLQKPIRLARLQEVLDLIESEDKGLRRVT